MKIKKMFIESGFVCRWTIIRIFAVFLVVLSLSLVGSSASALSGVNADNVKIKVYAKQGGDWFRALYTETNSDGILEVKGAIPGKYRIEVKSSDVESGQVIAGRFRMLDEDGRRLTKKTDVDAYMYIGGVKTLVTSLESDKEGWVSLSSITPDVVYSFDVRGESSLSKKDDKYRVEVSAKIDDSDWFRARYKRTDTSKVLRANNVLPGKYKFKYKESDAPASAPITLKLKMLDDDAKEINKKTTVNLYAYINGQKALIGTMKTDKDGWITVPGALTEVKYKITVK